MHEQPEPTPEEHDEAPATQGDHEAMRGAGHERPPSVEEIAGADEEGEDA
jgi:hypothetical protein